MSEGRVILLTGAGGFIGRHILREAAGSGDRWILTDLKEPDSWWGLPISTEFVAGDLADRGFCRDLFRSRAVTNIVHLAGWLGKGNTDTNRDQLLRANLQSTVHLLDASRSGAAPHFLLPSTGLVYGDQSGPFHERLEVAPQDDYAMSKHLAEQALFAYARQKLAKICVVRPAVIYGPGQRGDMFIPSLLKSLLAGERFPMTAGEQKRDMLCVDDLARALLGLVESGGEGVYNAGTGDGVLLREIARIAGELTGSPELLGIGDLAYRERETWDYALDSSALKSKISWQPTTGLREGILKTIQWENKAS
ncbi:MAG: NAD(P)-dependent oxidoreductase [Fibrobacterota bacterium]